MGRKGTMRVVAAAAPGDSPNGRAVVLWPGTTAGVARLRARSQLEPRTPEAARVATISIRHHGTEYIAVTVADLQGMARWSRCVVERELGLGGAPPSRSS